MSRGFFRFRIRTLLIAVAVIATVFGVNRRWHTFRLRAAWHATQAARHSASAQQAAAMEKNYRRQASSFASQAREYGNLLEMMRGQEKNPYYGSAVGRFRGLRDEDSELSSQCYTQAVKRRRESEHEAQVAEYHRRTQAEYLQRW